MKYVLCSLIGTGTDTDMQRVPFPTYQMLTPIVGGKVVCMVRDEDLLDSAGQPIPGTATQKLSAWLAAANVPQPIIDRIVAQYGDVDVTLAISPASLAALRANLNQRYPAHKDRAVFGVG